MNGVGGGFVTTSPTKVDAVTRDTSTGNGSSARMPIGDALTMMPNDAAETFFCAVCTAPRCSAASRVTSDAVCAASLSSTSGDATPDTLEEPARDVKKRVKTAAKV